MCPTLNLFNRNTNRSCSFSSIFINACIHDIRANYYTTKICTEVIIKLIAHMLWKTLDGYCILVSLELVVSNTVYAFGRSCDRPSRHMCSCFSSAVKKMLRCIPTSMLLLHASYVALPI
jgi:hypothetical protein